jgi:peptidoglycan/LPS O-acetylase OafA/YrhL
LVFPALLVRKWSGVAGVYLACGLAACLLPQGYMLPHYLPLFLIGISGFRYYVLHVSWWELAVCLAYSGLLTAYTEQTFYAIATILTCLCILFVHYTNRVLQFLGAISYSLYVTHQSIFGIPIAQGVRFLGNRPIVRLVVPFVSLALCLAVAWCLYRAVELPARKLSSRFKYGAARARATAA